MEVIQGGLDGPGTMACMQSRAAEGETMVGDRSSTVRWPSGLARIAGLAGLAFMCIVIVGNIVLEYLRIMEAPRDWLVTCAVAAVAVVALALASRRLRRSTVIVGALLSVWLGAGTVSSWFLTGTVDTRSFMLGLVAAGLYFGVAAAVPGWSGWTIFGLGAGWVLLNLYVYYRAYYSLGQAFPGTSWWALAPGVLTGSVTSVQDVQAPGIAPLPYPDGQLARLWALLFEVPEGTPQFIFNGLTGNGNLTGNFLTPLLAFIAPFAAGRWRSGEQPHRVGPLAARVVLAAAVLLPGFFLLYLMEARAAIMGLLASLCLLVALRVLPTRWTANRTTAYVAAVAVPALILVPYAMSRLLGLSLNGRDCIWNKVWLPAIQNSPVWGIGPPGRLSDACAPGAPAWFHAHNELFQAWSIGGLLGVSTALAALGSLTWFAVRYWRRDDAALIAVVVCCATLMGNEVLSTFRGDAVHLGIAWLLVIAGRSMALLHPSEEQTQRDSQLSRM